MATIIMLNQTQHEPESTKLNWQWNEQEEEIPAVLVAPVPLSLTKQELSKLTTELTSYVPSYRDNAERQLQSLDCRTQIAALAYLRKYKRSYLMWGVPMFIGILMATPLINSLLETHLNTVFIGMMPALVLSYAALRKSHKFSIISLSRFENTESISELVAALEINDEAVQAVLRPASLKILPQLKASDSKLLDADGRRILRRFLDRTRSSLSGSISNGFYPDGERLTVSILRSLRQVGDGSFLDVVTGLTDDRIEAHDRPIAVAAKECLPYLKQRALNFAASSELVRASAVSSLDGADTLVRPVTAKPALHEEELVRPIQ